jgi:gliding motility-associated-like protein
VLPVKKLIFYFLSFLLLPAIARSQCGSPINVFPYQEDFEATHGTWTSGGTGDDWVWGAPSKTVITGAGQGNKCWITGGLSGSSYSNGERSFVQSPCFDFTTLSKPYIHFKICWETEKQYDGASLQYSLNGGFSWQNAGSVNDATDCLNSNWFNNASITNLSTLAAVKEGWSGTILPTSGSCLGGQGSNGWLDARHTLPNLAGEPQVIFRFIFGSGTTCNDYDGFAFDEFVISEAPSVPTLSSLPTAAGCTVDNGSITITVTGGAAPFLYSWSPNVSSGTQAFNLAAGTYTVTVTDGNGCSATIGSTVPSPTVVMLAATSLPDTCSSGKGAAFASASGGTPPFDFLWSNGATSDMTGSLDAGSYSVTVTDSMGCEAQQNITIAETGSFEISLGADRTICGNAGFTLQVGAYSSYLWQDASTNATYQVTQPGAYYVTVENSSGCVAADTVTVTENCLDDVILPNAFTPNDDGRNDLFVASGSDITSWFLEVRGRWGNLVYQSNKIEEGWDGRQNGIAAPAGTYVWKAYFSTGSSPAREKAGTVFLLR